MKLEEMTGAQLRTRCISLDTSIRKLSGMPGTEDKVDELQAELDLLQEEREKRHLNHKPKEE